MAREWGDPTYYYGDPTIFVAWDGTHIVRTADVLASSPVWEDISGTVDGTIYDGQYVIGPNSTVAMWLLTSTAVWVCQDIKAPAPVWQEALTIETIHATEADPSPGTTELKCFATYAQEPGFCCVATGIVSGNNTYGHAYFWHTHDYGDTWTLVDVGHLLDAGDDFSFIYAPRLGMQIFPSSVSGDPGTIWCIRMSPPNLVTNDTCVFKSTDGGHSWLKGVADMAEGSSNRDLAALLAPGPAISDPAYIVNGATGTTDRPDIRRSVDQWGAFDLLTANGDPTGYGGINNVANPYRRPERRYGGANHVLAWFRHTATTHAHLLESEDAGDNWTLLYDSGAAQTYATPINWPPDPNLWAWTRFQTTGDLATVTAAVRLTVDNFANVLDKTGNLDSVIAAWTNGAGGGFFLPKVALTFSHYAVADGHNQAQSAMVTLDPQPKSRGVEITRRPHSPNGSIVDQAKYLWLEWDTVESATQYQSILTQLGLDNALTNFITIAARDEYFTWRRYNGIAVKPQIGQDGEWNQFFLRGVRVLVKFLEVIEDE